MKVVEAMVQAPQQSLPQQCEDWAALKAAYRLLSNDRVDPQAIGRPHREWTLRQCTEHAVVLLPQDDSDLNFTTRTKVQGLGMIGDGKGRGIMQHTTLALTEEGRVLGLADQFWFNRREKIQGETRRQRQSRWAESDVWAEAVQHVADLCGQVAPRMPGRWIHLMDRGGDVWTALATCRSRGHGFVIRARHNRALEDEQTWEEEESEEALRLWKRMAQEPVAGTLKIQVAAQRTGRRKRRKRKATVSVRFAQVTLRPPVNDPRCKDDAPMDVWGVWVHEDHPPDGEEPVQWMLLCSEPVESFEDAVRVIGWYEKRWVVEEFHRALKEGCRIERSQLDDAEDLKRLASIQSVVAVRLLQLRDLAGMGDASDASSPRAADVDDPQVLQATTPTIWIEVVAALAKVDPATLGPRQFLLTIARRGGFIGRKHDGRPGWKTLWQGWYETQLLVRGAELYTAAKRSG